MKPVHGDTVSNGSYSSTSCSYRSESGQPYQGCRNNLSKLFHDKYIPLRESKLLRKLVKTRALYEELRNQLLSSSNSSKPEQQQGSVEKDVKGTEKSNIVALVDLVDKGVILKPKLKLVECRSYNNRKSRLIYGPKDHTQRKTHAREFLTSKSSIISKRRLDEESRFGINLKTKNIKSDPCNCTIKYSEIMKIKSKEVLKGVHCKEITKFNRESNRKIINKLRRSKPYIEGEKSSIVKSIQALDKNIENLKAGKNTFSEKINISNERNNSKARYSSDTHKTFISECARADSTNKENGKNKSCLKICDKLGNPDINENLMSHDNGKNYKNRTVCEKRQVEIKRADKNELNTYRTPRKVADSSAYSEIPRKSSSRCIVTENQIKENINWVSQEQTNKLFEIMAALLPKKSKRSIQPLLTDFTTKTKRKMPKISEKVIISKNVENLTARLVGDVCRTENNDYTKRGQGKNYSNLNVKSDTLPRDKIDTSNQPHNNQENNIFNKKAYNDVLKPTSRNSANDNGYELRRHVAQPININIIKTDCIIPKNIHAGKKINNKRKRKTLRSCESFVGTFLECIPNMYEKNKHDFYRPCNELLISQKVSKSPHSTNASSKLKINSVKKSLPRYILTSSHSKNHLNEGTIKGIGKSIYTLPKHRVRNSLYSSKLGTKRIGINLAKPVRISKKIAGSLDRLAIVPKTYRCHKRMINMQHKGGLTKKSTRKPRRYIKFNESRNFNSIASYLTYFIHLTKNQVHSSSVTYKSDVLIKSYKPNENYSKYRPKEKHVSNESSYIPIKNSKRSFKNGLKRMSFISDKDFYNKDHPFDNDDIDPNTLQSTSVRSEKERGWMISPAITNCYYYLQSNKKNKMSLKNQLGSNATIQANVMNENTNFQSKAATKGNKELKMSGKDTSNVQPHVYPRRVCVPQGFGIKKCLKKINMGKTINIEIAKQKPQIKLKDNLKREDNFKFKSSVQHRESDTQHLKKCELCSNAKEGSRQLTAHSDLNIQSFCQPELSANNLLKQKCTTELTNSAIPENMKPNYKAYKLTTKEIDKRTFVSHKRRKNCNKISEIHLTSNKHPFPLKLFKYYEQPVISKLLATKKIVPPAYIVNTIGISEPKLNTSQRLLVTKANGLSAFMIKKRQSDLNQVYCNGESSSNILSVSTIAFKSKKSFFHESKFKLLSSTDKNNISKEILEIKSKLSCEVNFSKHIFSKRSCVKTTQFQKYPLIVGQRELRHLDTNGSVMCPSQIIRPIEVKNNLTGVSSLLRRCFCTMNIQVGKRGHPKKYSHKLKDYECEPGVCIPYECDPYECQKLIMQRLMRKVSRMSNTEKKSRSISSVTLSKSKLKAKKVQSSSSRERKRKLLRAKPRGLTYQTLPKRPQTQQQSHRQATRIGSAFSFDIEFSKNKTNASLAKEPVTVPNAQSISTNYKSSDKRLRDKGYGTRRGANKRHRQSQSAMRKMYNRASTVTPAFKRCFCTLKLQKRGKQQKVKDFHTTGTSTPTEKKVPEKQILRTRERGQTAKLKNKMPVLLPYECEPGVCIPGECDPYECLELIKKRNKRSRGTASMPSNMSSNSSMTSTRKKRLRPKHSQARQVHTEPIGSKETLVRSKPSVLSTDRLSTSSAKQAVKLGSTFSFNVEFYKDRNKISTTPSVYQKASVRQHIEKTPKIRKKHKTEKRHKTTKKPKMHASKSVDAKRKKIKHSSSQNREYSQSVGQSTRMNSLIKRCFCTAKLQGLKKKNLPKKSYESTSTATEGSLPMKIEKPVKTQTRHRQHALKPYECEPGVCVPGACDPYECLKLIKKRHAREQGSGTERHRTKSVSSSFTSSKTSKAGVAQSMLQTVPYEKVKQPQFTAPSESVIVQEESSEESTTHRQAVRIGSTFSFDIEFYKERQFPSYRRVQAASEAIRSTRRKMRAVNRSKKRKNKASPDMAPPPSQTSQTEEVDKTDKALGPMLRRCFCTLKLQKNQRRRRQYKPMKPPRTKVKPPRHRGTETPFSRLVPDLHDRSVMTAYKLKTNPYKLDPYECEPGVCVPGECDPYECLERIKRRHMDQGSSTDNVKTKSSLIMTKGGRRRRDNKMQYSPKERKAKIRKVGSKFSRADSRGEPRPESRSIVSSPSGSKQAVKIGSNFSFNVEFYKDRSRSGSVSGPKPQSRGIRYDKPKRAKVRHGVSRTSQGISVSTRRRKIQHTKAVRDSDSQMMAKKMRSTMTGVAPFLKRCFCTLQLQKRMHKGSKPKKPSTDSANISVGTETMKYKPEIHSMDRGTHTKKKYKFKGRTLEPYECEPGVCVPGQCDPYECLERIKRRGMHSKQSSTERNRSHSVSSSAVDIKTSRPTGTHVRSPKEKKVRTTRTYERPSVKERVTYDASPIEPSQKQAVRLGSSFSFNIEFYKDRNRQVVNTLAPEGRSEAIKYRKPIRRTRSGTTPKRSRSMASSYRSARSRGRKMQSQLQTRSQGSGTGPLLKRCFCTLKLQKIGKHQILSNTQMQTSPTTLETTYKHAGTKARKRREAKAVAARERGTKTKRHRRALEPYECEPGVCIPGECDPYECLERIKRRNMRHSSTGMAEVRTKSMSSFTPSAKTPKSMNTSSVRRRRHRRRNRHAESHYKMRQPPRPSRALENINVNNRQAVRLGSDFAFNIEFYKDRSKTTMPPCSPSICKEPVCTPSKCKTSSCSTRCPQKHQGTYDAGLRHHRKLQSRSARTESRGSSVRRLKRCFCTLTLQRAEVNNTVMNSLRTATVKVKTQDKITGTKSKYFQQLLPYECEPGVCIPGECDPYECLERIKRRRGPYGPCDCLEKRRAKIRRVSRTTETSIRRSREVPARQLISGIISRKTQFVEPPRVSNVVEQPRFKLFNKPYTKNSVKISSNFSFNVEFTRDISFPSSTVESEENSGDCQCYQEDNTPKIKKARDTQKPVALKNETTATDLFRRCFCTKQLLQMESTSREQKPYGSQILRKCFCPRKTAQYEPVPTDDRVQEPHFLRRCFCAKNLFKSRGNEEVVTILPSKSTRKQQESIASSSHGRESLSSYINPNMKCQCKAQCLCAPKGKIKCLCPPKKLTKCLCSKGGKIKCLCPQDITVARVEIKRLYPKLQKSEQHHIKEFIHTEKLDKNLSKCSFTSQNLLKSRSDNYNSKTIHEVPSEPKKHKVLKCLGRHKLIKTKSEHCNSEMVTRSVSSNRQKCTTLKHKLFSIEVPRYFRTRKVLKSSSEQRRSPDFSTTSVQKLKDKMFVAAKSMQLYSLNTVNDKSDVKDSKTGSAKSKLIIKTKNTSTMSEMPEARCGAKLLRNKIEYRENEANTMACFDKRTSLSKPKPKKYWVQYQMQRPRMRKRCQNRNTGMTTIDRKQNLTNVKTSSTSLETIMSYSPQRFIKSESKTLCSNRTCNVANSDVRFVTVGNRKPSKKCGCSISSNNQCCRNCSKFKLKPTCSNTSIKINKEVSKKNIVYTSERLILEKHKVSIENIQTRERHSYSDLKKRICNCLHIFKLKKCKRSNKKCANTQCPNRDISQYDNLPNISNKVGIKWEQKSQAYYQSLTEETELKNIQVQCSRSNKYCDKNNTNTCNIVKKDEITSCNNKSSRCPTVSFHNKITFYNTQNTQCASADCNNKISYCKSQNTQCPSADFNGIKIYCKSQNSQCPRNSLNDNMPYCKSQNSQCPSSHVHDKLTHCNIQKTRCISTDLHDKIPSRKSQNLQCPAGGSHDKIKNCVSKNVQCATSVSQNKTPCNKIECPQEKCDMKQTSFNAYTCFAKQKYELIKKILGCRCKLENKAKFTKVVKVTSDLKHLICANNAIYEIKDIVPPGACGDYKFAFVLESKGIKGDAKVFCVNDKCKKKKECPKKHKRCCTCLLYKKKDKHGQKCSEYHKVSCPCFVFKKRNALPLKSSSDQKISCHMMEVCRIFKPKAEICYRKRPKGPKESYPCDECDPRIKREPCKCGNPICAKETKKIAERDELNAKHKLFEKKKCVCGSALCAAKLNKKKLDIRRQDRKKQKERLKKYKKDDAKRLRKRKKYNKLKDAEAMEDTKSNNDSLLVIQSLLDLKNLAAESAKNFIRGGFRAIKDPKYACLHIKDMISHPTETLSKVKQTCKKSCCNSTFKRVCTRLGALSFVQKVKNVLESEPIFNYLLHIKDKKKRLRPRPLKIGDEHECKMYVASLRRKPCFWVYYLWPWFYPHCIGGLRMFKQFTDILLFLFAIVVWSPCLLGTELCRAMMCCLICTG